MRDMANRSEDKMAADADWFGLLPEDRKGSKAISEFFYFLNPGTLLT
jgi:hypothetical protein